MDAEPAGGEAVIHPGPPLARLCDWILAFSARTARGCAEKIRKALLESLAAGRSVYETRVEMEAVHAGLSQYQSEWIARTEGVRAYAEGQVAALAEVGAERVPWLATGDERTCPTCGPRDGVTYDINERPLLPLHPNCRCTRTAAARGSCRMMSWTGCGRNWCEQSRLAPRTPAWHAGRQNPPGSNSGKPLRELTLGDLQSFADTLGELAPASRARSLSAVKSLLAFAHRLGYRLFDVGAPLPVPGRKNALAEWILSEAEVHRMLALEANPGNSVLLRLLYAAGLRVSELCELKWRDLQPRGEGGQVTVYGKGSKTRAVLLTKTTWGALQELQPAAAVPETAERRIASPSPETKTVLPSIHSVSEPDRSGQVA